MCYFHLCKAECSDLVALVTSLRLQPESQVLTHRSLLAMFHISIHFFFILLYIYIYISLLRSRYCNNVRLFSKIIKNISLFCIYFAAILVTSSVQPTLQHNLRILYSTAPNKIAIRLTKSKNANCQAKVSQEYKSISNKKHIQRRKSLKCTPVE